MTYTLYGRPRWGSAIVEAELVWYGLPFRMEPVGDLLRDAAARLALEKVNPLAQIPTLVMPDGTVMSESVAITLLLADVTGDDSLVPGPKAKERASFLRWLVFLVANLYPTFTYGDIPGRFVPVEAAQAPFLAKVEAYREKLWRQVEGEAAKNEKGPWFLGDRFSAIDIFITVMTFWNPKRPWFEKETPKLYAIATCTEQQPKLKDMWARNQ
jgi:GST-like protein